MQLTTEHSEPAEGFPLGTYLAVIGRRKWLVVGVTVLFVVLGYAYLKGRTPMYSASAELLYAQPANGLDPLAPAVVDQTLQQADLGSVPTVLNGSAVSARAAQLLAHTNTSAGYSVTALLQLDTQTNAYSNIVAIDGVSSSPSLAAAVANAYARAFVGWRQTSAQAQVGEAVLAVQSRLGAYTTPTSQATADYVALRAAARQPAVTAEDSDRRLHDPLAGRPALDALLAAQAAHPGLRRRRRPAFGPGACLPP